MIFTNKILTLFLFTTNKNIKDIYKLYYLNLSNLKLISKKLDSKKRDLIRVFFKKFYKFIK